MTRRPCALGATLCLLAVLFAQPWGCAAPPSGDQERKDAVYAQYARTRQDFPEVREIDAAGLMALLRADSGRVVLVDARSPAEQRVSTIPGAVASDVFLKDPAAYAGKLVVGYCTVGYRSGIVASRLAAQGVTMVNLRGGILAWVHDGGPLVDADGKATRNVHVYGRKWDLAPRGYKAVWSE